VREGAGQGRWPGAGAGNAGRGAGALRPAGASVRALALALALVAGVALGACGSPPPRTTTPPAAASTTSGVASTTSTSPATSVSTSSPTPPGCVQPPAAWPVPRLADQLLMVIGYFTALPSLATEAAAGVGGFVFLGEPADGQRTAVRSGLAGLVSDAAAAGQVVPWMSTDTEGGPVSRLADILGPIPSPRQMAGQWTPAQVQSAMASRGAAMKSLGITMDLAPVLDTASPTDAVADESARSFSDTPRVVATYGDAYASGLRAAGVVAVGKHFPGLGHANADTDTGPATDPPLSELESDDLIPFESAVTGGIPVVMVGHPVVPGLSDGLPASLAPATYSLLRRTLRFSGVAMTDSLAAVAISAAGYTEASAAVAAIEAGADMAMVASGTWEAALTALEQALDDGALSLTQARASAERALAAKHVAVCRS
jgi:beta-N-acetylhexosaminidase